MENNIHYTPLPKPLFYKYFYYELIIIYLESRNRKILNPTDIEHNTMKGWEESIKIFLKPWIKQNHVLGAILTGSYATGLQTKNSDINIHIILDNNTLWRNRGYKTIDGHHISYFATPFRQILAHLNQDKEFGKNIDATALSRGSILFDKTGVVEKLKNHAKKELATAFPDLDNTYIELFKAGIHDGFIKLQSAYEDKTIGFSFAYHLYLNTILSYYARYLKADLPHQEKIGAFLTDKSFQNRYGISSIPDTRFKSLFKEALQQGAKTKQLEAARKLRNYTIKKMGGFNKNDWSVREHLYENPSQD